MQQRTNKALISDLVSIDHLIKYLQSTKTRGLTFKPELDWYNPVLIVIGDSSHGGEVECIDDWEELEPFRSQGAKILVRGECQLADGQPGMMHIISLQPHVVRGVCRSTVQAEAYNLDLCVEDGDLLIATIADLRGQLDRRIWETSAAVHTHSA